MSTPSFHHFAVRRLNPFRGTIQICASGEARALSTDGRHWEIQILAPRPDDMWGGAPPGTPASQFIRFGAWSRDGGLRQVPANPLLDLAAMLSRSKSLIAELEQAVERLPFPLADRWELWLHDTDGDPLALIASSTAPDRLQPPPHPRWLAERAPALREREPSSGTPFDEVRLERLERLVNQTGAAGEPRWYRREADGSGQPLDDIGAPPLSADRFPTLLLRDRWGSDEIDTLVDDYLAWRAPALLTLPGLAPALRGRLERQARANAVAMARLWRLYPAITDQELLRAARVEARLRQR